MKALDWRLAINSVTLKTTPLEKALSLASMVGFDGFGFWVKDLKRYISSGNSVGDLVRLLHSANLEACELLAVRRWQEVPMSEFASAAEEARQVFDLASQLEIGTVTSPAGPTSHSLADWVDRLRKISDIATSYDVRVALEFIKGRSVESLRSAMEIVRAVRRDNIGVLLDLFHFHKSRSTVLELSKSDPGEIILVHLDDVPGKPLDQLRDKDRVFPGDGVIPCREIVSVLADLGYEGYFSVEIFNDEYWGMDGKIVAKRSIDKARSILTSATRDDS